MTRSLLCNLKLPLLIWSEVFPLHSCSYFHVYQLSDILMPSFPLFPWIRPQCAQYHLSKGQCELQVSMLFFFVWVALVLSSYYDFVSLQMHSFYFRVLMRPDGCRNHNEPKAQWLSVTCSRTTRQTLFFRTLDSNIGVPYVTAGFRANEQSSGY